VVQSKKKKVPKLPDEVQKALDDWDAFEKSLELKRKKEQKERKKATRERSSTVGSKSGVSMLEGLKKMQSNSEESLSTEVRQKRALSVSDGIEMSVQKLQQRKEKKKRASDQLKEIKVEEIAKEEPHKKQKTEENKTENKTEETEDQGKVRQWKVRMNDMRNKKREDYVSYYKTINKKNESDKQEEPSTQQNSVSHYKPAISDSFVHFYLALRGDVGGKDNKK